jgi:hypothetical protein
MADLSQTCPERCDPTLPKARLALRFNGDDLRLMIGVVEVMKYPAVSGLPPYDCSPNGQRQANKGPLPEGIYWIRPDEMERARNTDRESWGPYRIRIHPFVTTETFGRDRFYIHGGSYEGSKGCIDLVDRMAIFRSHLLAYLDSTGTDAAVQIHLTVDYSSARECPTEPILK